VEGTSKAVSLFISLLCGLASEYRSARHIYLILDNASVHALAHGRRRDLEI